MKPLDQESNCVSVRFKEELKDQLVDTGPRVISDSRLPILVRQLAVHVNVSDLPGMGIPAGNGRG